MDQGARGADILYCGGYEVPPTCRDCGATVGKGQGLAGGGYKLDASSNRGYGGGYEPPESCLLATLRSPGYGGGAWSG